MANFYEQSQEYKAAMRELGLMGLRDRVVGLVRQCIRKYEKTGIICPTTITHDVCAAMNIVGNRKFADQVREVAGYEMLCYGRPPESLAAAFDAAFAGDSRNF